MPPVPAITTSRHIALAAAQHYRTKAHSENTKRAYDADWRHYAAWCHSAGCTPIPATPQVVGAYLASMAASYKVATIRRHLCAIVQAHRLGGIKFWPSHPDVRDVMLGIAAQHGSAQKRAAAFAIEDIRKLAAACGAGLTGLRDRALVLIAFAGALRRTEIVALDREHITFDGTGLRLMIPHAKGDQQGKGAEIGIPKGQHPATCPVRAMEAWLDASNCVAGPVFRKIDQWGNIEAERIHHNTVPLIVRKLAGRARLTVPVGERLSPHCLRVGFITEAFKAGARDEQIMQHSRHKAIATMHGYIRRARLMLDSPVKLVGL